jgi:arylsulfatase A-like enzyme
MLARTSVLILLAFCATEARAAGPRPPNFVIVFTDDQGYGDVGCYGAKGFRTPNLDRLVREGMRFTGFHAAQPVCSASRAALLTGCYPNRIGILGAPGGRDGTARLWDAATGKPLGEPMRHTGYISAVAFSKDGRMIATGSWDGTAR